MESNEDYDLALNPEASIIDGFALSENLANIKFA